MTTTNQEVKTGVFYVLDSKFDVVFDGQGKRVTGAISSYNTEDRGYPSYKFGAPIEFSPSRPRLITKIIRSDVNSEVKIVWDSVYDRDGDLEYYLVEIGSYPGGSDVKNVTTTENHHSLKLPLS
ncbi:MAG: hypothetical protein VXY00_00525, partial [Candidatus Latescibacterota bacterium]|nr:hypothetical protein [Candidatus Latescibacterota bacterium]